MPVGAWQLEVSPLLLLLPLPVLTEPNAAAAAAIGLSVVKRESDKTAAVAPLWSEAGFAPPAAGKLKGQFALALAPTAQDRTGQRNWKRGREWHCQKAETVVWAWHPAGLIFRNPGLK
jgi:hypothetical protein